MCLRPIASMLLIPPHWTSNTNSCVFDPVRDNAGIRSQRHRNFVSHREFDCISNRSRSRKRLLRTQAF